MRLSTSSWICCAVAPGQITIAVIDGTEKFGSSSWPSFVKPSTPPMPITRIRNSTMARWFSAHSVRLNDFIGRPASCRHRARSPGSATRNPGRHLLHAGGDDERRRPAARTRAPRRCDSRGLPPAMSSTVPTGSAPARRTTHSAGWPLLCVIAAAGIDADCGPAASALGDQRGASRRAAVPAASRASSGRDTFASAPPPAATARAGRRRTSLPGALASQAL